MEVHVCNRHQAMIWKPEPGYVAISIGVPGERPTTLLEGWDATLYLEFHDVVREDSGFVAFDTELATAVHRFIEMHPDKDFMIHCGAGFSRSMAIGIFMRDTIDNVQLHKHAMDAERAANSLVLQKLRQREWLVQLSGGLDPFLEEIARREGRNDRD